jgi:hypothetical protein
MATSSQHKRIAAYILSITQLAMNERFSLKEARAGLIAAAEVVTQIDLDPKYADDHFCHIIHAAVERELPS